MYSFRPTCRFDCAQIRVQLFLPIFFGASSVLALKCFLPRTSYAILQLLLDSGIDAACTSTPTSDIMAESVALLAASQISRLKRAALNNSPRRRRANFTLSPYALRQSRRRRPGSRFQSNLLSVKKRDGVGRGVGWWWAAREQKDGGDNLCDWRQRRRRVTEGGRKAPHV